MNTLLRFCIVFSAVYMVFAENDVNHLAKEIQDLLKAVDDVLHSIDNFEQNKNVTSTKLISEYQEYSKHLKDEEENLDGFTSDYCNSCKDNFNDYNFSKVLDDLLANETKVYNSTVIPRIPQFEKWSHDLEQLSKNLSNCNNDETCIANISAIFTGIQNNASSLIKSETVQKEVANIMKVVNQSVNLVLKDMSSRGNLAVDCLTELDKVKKEIKQDINNITLTINNTIVTVSSDKLDISQLANTVMKTFENSVSTCIKNATDEIRKREDCAKVNIDSCKSQEPDWEGTKNTFLIDFNHTILSMRNYSLNVLDVNIGKLNQIKMDEDKLLQDVKNCEDLSCIRDTPKEVERQFDACLDQISECSTKITQSIYDFKNNTKLIEKNFTTYSREMINGEKNDIIECIDFIEEGINKTALAGKIKAFMRSVNDAEINIVKLEDEMTNNFTQYNEYYIVVVYKQYSEMNNSIERNEAKINIEHKSCHDLENSFKTYSDDLFKTLREYNNTYRNFTDCEYVINKLHENITHLSQIDSKLGNCKEEEFDCLKEVYTSLEKYTNLTKDLGDLMENLEHSIQKMNETFVASIGENVRRMVTAGNQSINCLNNLNMLMDDLKSKFIVPLNKTIDTARSNITEEFARAKLFARKLGRDFESNLTRSLSEKENEAGKIKEKLVKLNITGELCGEDRTDFHEILENYCDIYYNYIAEGKNTFMESKNETFLKLKEYSEIQVRVQREFSLCYEEICLRTVINDSVSQLSNLSVKITDVSNSLIETIVPWISALESNATNINKNFSASLNKFYEPVLHCLSQMKNSTDQVVELDHTRSEIPNYLTKQLENITTRIKADAKDFENGITASLNDANEEIEHKRTEAHEKQLDISSCDKKITDMENKVNSSLESFSNSSKEFKTNITTKVNESIQYIEAFRSDIKDTFEKISTCLEKSCMDKLVEQFRNKSLEDLDLSERKENSTVSYIRDRLTSFKDFRNQYLNKILVELKEMKGNVLSCIKRVENSSNSLLSNFLLLCFVILFQFYTSYN